MEIPLRTALLEWLRTDPAIAGQINIVAEEAPPRASLPWLGIVASASTDWSTKDRAGREVRVAIELHTRGDDAAGAASLTQAIERRAPALPDQPGFEIATAGFLRARAEQRPRNTRATLLEYRFRLLSTEN